MTVPDTYDLYGDWALHLGKSPQQWDNDVSTLSVAVAPVKHGEFYHFGRTRDVIDSMYDLQNVVTDQTELGAVPSLAQPRQFIQDANFGVPVRRTENESLWVENGSIPSTWKIGKRHMLTGVPKNDWTLQLNSGTCLDFAPISETLYAIRCGFDDAFRGLICEQETRWLEQPAQNWFDERGIDLDAAGIASDCDIQQAPIFPVVDKSDLCGEFIQWLVGQPDSERPDVDRDRKHRNQWLATRRVSARDIAHSANLIRIHEQRDRLREEILPLMAAHANQSVFYKLDLSHTAATFARSDAPVPKNIDASGDLMLAVHNRMFRSEVLRPWR